MKLFFAPHNDDEVLFGAFTIMRENPLVVIVFDGYVQAERDGAPVTAAQRRAESLAALRELGAAPPMFLGFRDTDKVCGALPDAIADLIRKSKPEAVYAPAIEDGGHDQHNLVGKLVAEAFSGTRHYMTYTRTRGKSTGVPVRPGPGFLQRKLRALACYDSQIGLANCREHFLRDQNEYLAS